MRLGTWEFGLSSWENTFLGAMAFFGALQLQSYFRCEFALFVP